MENELENGSVELATNVKAMFPDRIEFDADKILIVLCSIAISLKKMAEEANHATASMRVDK